MPALKLAGRPQGGSVAGTLPMLSHLSMGAPPYAHFAEGGMHRRATPWQPRAPASQGTGSCAQWPGFHEESHFGYVTTARSRVLVLCTAVRRRGTPSSREARRSSATAATRTRVAVVGQGGGSQADPLPRRLPVRQPEAAGTFGVASSTLMGCLGCARLAFLALRGVDPGWPRYWSSTRSEVYAFFVLGKHYRYAAGGPRALPEVLCRVGETLTDRTRRCIFGPAAARILYALQWGLPLKCAQATESRELKVRRPTGRGRRLDSAAPALWQARLPTLRAGPENQSQLRLPPARPLRVLHSVLSIDGWTDALTVPR